MWVTDHDHAGDGEEETQRGKVLVCVSVDSGVSFQDSETVCDFFLIVFFHSSDNREATQRQNQQQSVGAAEARPHGVREAGEDLSVPQGSSGFLRLPLGCSWFLRVPQGYSGFLKVPQGYSGFLRVPQGSHRMETGLSAQ